MNSESAKYLATRLVAQLNAARIDFYAVYLIFRNEQESDFIPSDTGIEAQLRYADNLLAKEFMPLGFLGLRMSPLSDGVASAVSWDCWTPQEYNGQDFELQAKKDLDIYCADFVADLMEGLGAETIPEAKGIQ